MGRFVSNTKFIYKSLEMLKTIDKNLLFLLKI